MQIKNLFESAYYRRLILAYIVDEHGPINSAEIIERLGWPKNTVKSNLSGIKDLGVEIEFVGARRTGGYELKSWGPIKKSWIKTRFAEFKDAVETFSVKE